MSRPGDHSPGLSSPVLIVAGGAASLRPEETDRVRPLLAAAFRDFSGTIISGGTTSGVPGCVGEVGKMCRDGTGAFRVVGYLPRLRPADATADDRYDELIPCGEKGFSAEQIIKTWQDILGAGISLDSVRLLGFAGGRISAIEYRVALALGAVVGVVEGFGGAAAEVLQDELWQAAPNLLQLPADNASIRAFAQPPHVLHPDKEKTKDSAIEAMAIKLHENYVQNRKLQLPENMRTWDELDDTYRTASREQARYAIQLLEQNGFTVHLMSASDTIRPFDGFTDAEFEQMAEMEHGRWNVERLLDGWQWGPVRDDEQKRHPCIVPWYRLSGDLEPMKEYDREAIRAFADLLEQAGYVIARKTKTARRKSAKRKKGAVCRRKEA